MLPELIELVLSYINYEDFISDVITAEPPVGPWDRPLEPNHSVPYMHIDNWNGTPSFPPPIFENGILKEYCVNMMPFIFGDHNTLPEECKRYIPQINLCIDNCQSEYGKVCYLTIDEKFVKAGNSHRREGLHVETIGLKNGYGTYYFYPPNWGGAYGGIFFGSNIDDSTQIYDYYISDDRVIGLLGSVEHLRPTLEFKSKYEKPENKYWEINVKNKITLKINQKPNTEI